VIYEVGKAKFMTLTKQKCDFFV